MITAVRQPGTKQQAEQLLRPACFRGPVSPPHLFGSLIADPDGRLRTTVLPNQHHERNLHEPDSHAPVAASPASGSALPAAFAPSRPIAPKFEPLISAEAAAELLDLHPVT